MGRDPQPPLPTNTHALHTVLQSGDHSPFPDAKRILLAFLNQLASIEIQVVPNVYLRATLSARTISELNVFIFNTAATSPHGKAAQRQSSPRARSGAKRRRVRVRCNDGIGVT